MTKQAIELNQVQVSSLVAIGRDGTHYLWSAADDTTDYLVRLTARHEYEAKHNVKAVPLSDVLADYDTEKAFIFYVADCFDPPLFLVFGRSWEDAYETFITEKESLVKIDDADLADYDQDSLNYNDNGTAVDTESVQGIEVSHLVLTTK